MLSRTHLCNRVWGAWIFSSPVFPLPHPSNPVAVGIHKLCQIQTNFLFAFSGTD